MIIAGLSQSVDFFMTTFMTSGGGSTIIISVLVIYSLALLVVGILFVSEYVVREDVVVAEVNQYVEPKSFINSYKVYFRR